MPTLEQLEQRHWTKPAFDSYLNGRCYELRKKSIEEFTTEDLRIMIGQGIGLRFLLPIAATFLEADPLAEGDYYPGDLLKSVMTADPYFYLGSPTLTARVVGVAGVAADRLSSSSDDADLVAAIQHFISQYLPQLTEHP